MKNKAGFIQIPILIAIIVGIVVVGGIGYVSVNKYKDFRSTKDGDKTETTTEIETLKQELEQLKEQVSQGQISQDQVQQQNSKKIISEPPPQKPQKFYNLSSSEIINKIKPTVVYIETSDGSGSGVIIETTGSIGYILTNAHVVTRSNSAQVELSSSITLPAMVVGRNEIIDLAILKVTGQNITAAELGDSSNLSQGDKVFAFGFPFGLKGEVSFKEGTMSRLLGRDGISYIETSVDLFPGNSGGPLVSEDGRVVGINTSILGLSYGEITVGETIKLTIPINIAKSYIPGLKNGEAVTNPVYEKYSNFKKWSDFEDQRIAIDDYFNEGSVLVGDALLRISNGDYFSASSKAEEAYSIISETMDDLKSLQVPDFPFSKSTKSIVSLYLSIYKIKLEIAAHEQAVSDKLKIASIAEEDFWLDYLNKTIQPLLLQGISVWESKLNPALDLYYLEVKQYFK